MGNNRRSQFFIVASVIILINLAMISQQVSKSTFPVFERPVDEFAFSNDVSEAAADLSRSAPQYLFKRGVWLLNYYSKSVSGWKFDYSLCCQDACDCPSVNIANFTSPLGEPVTIRITSDKVTMSSSFFLKAG